jgi:branched-chain amino acid transport system ATP-binding protein
MPDALRVHNVTAGYDETVVLEDVSIAVPQGHALAVLGRNGVGKTTLLATTMGLATLHSGTVSVDGADITRVPVHERIARGLGYVPQEREIFASLTVEENLRVSTRPGEWTIPRVGELFPRLAERNHHFGNQLSGGEQQMLAMARALVGNPTILLLDEPFAGLAPIIVQALSQALTRLRRESGFTIVLVEQHAALALELAEHAVVLDRGHLVWSGDSETLRNEPSFLARLMGLQDAPAPEREIARAMTNDPGLTRG